VTTNSFRERWETHIFLSMIGAGIKIGQEEFSGKDKYSQTGSELTVLRNMRDVLDCEIERLSRLQGSEETAYNIAHKVNP